MKYFLLDTIMHNETLSKFIAFTNEFPNEDWTIVIDNGGGKESVCRTMLHMINSRKDRVTLIGSAIYSSAFELFADAQCKKYLVHGAMGMWHLAYSNVSMGVDGKPLYHEDIAIMKKHKETSRDKGIEIAKKYLTPEEMRSYKKGNDVYFTFKRLQEIFPDIEIL